MFYRLVMGLVVFMVLVVPAAYSAEVSSDVNPERETIVNKTGMPQEDVIVTEDVVVDGKVMFAYFYTVDGQRCRAFIETEDGSIICVLDSDKIADLEKELGGKSGNVKLEGKVIAEEADRKFIKTEKYSIKK